MQNEKRFLILFFVATTFFSVFVLELVLEDIFSVFKLVNFKVLGGTLNMSQITATGIAFFFVFYCSFVKKEPGRFVKNIYIEFNKVTWATAKETRTNTLIVIFVAIIIASILGFFDFVFFVLTNDYLFLH